MKKNRMIILFLMISIIFVLFVTGASAENYPEREIRLVVPWNPGGSTDTLARMMEKVIRENDLLPVPLVITNIPGASGVIGTEEVYASEPDGYMLILGETALAVAKVMEITELSYTKDFEPVASVADGILACIVREDAPWNTFADLVSHAKENPGEQRWSWSPGGNTMLAGYGLTYTADLDIIYVPADGSSEMITNILGGHVDVITPSIGSSHAYIDSGDLKILGINNDTRIKQFPETPTLKEQGYDLVFSQSFGIFAPPETPKEIIEYLENVFNKAMETEEWIEALESRYFLPNSGTGKDLVDTFERTTKTIEKLLKSM